MQLDEMEAVLTLIHRFLTYIDAGLETKERAARRRFSHELEVTFF